jgi:hypothetical protein
VTWPALLIGVIAAILLVLGLIPPYFELWKRDGRVVGFSKKSVGLTTVSPLTDDFLSRLGLSQHRLPGCLFFCTCLRYVMTFSYQNQPSRIPITLTVTNDSNQPRKVRLISWEASCTSGGKLLHVIPSCQSYCRLTVILLPSIVLEVGIFASHIIWRIRHRKLLRAAKEAGKTVDEMLESMEGERSTNSPPGDLESGGELDSQHQEKSSPKPGN